MGRLNIIPEHEQQEMGFMLDSQPPREKYRGNEQPQDEGQKKKSLADSLIQIQLAKQTKKTIEMINYKSTDKQ